METKDVEVKVKEILTESLPELKHQEFDLDKNQDQFESWDSFSHMEIVGKVEEKFGINLDITEVVELDSPRKIVEAVKGKLDTK